MNRPTGSYAVLGLWLPLGSYWNRAATTHQYTYDLFVDTMSLTSGSLYGQTLVQFTGGGFAAVVKTYGESTDGSAVGAFMGSSLVTAHIRMCGGEAACELFEGKWKGGVLCTITKSDGATLECSTGELPTGGLTDARLVLEWNGSPYPVECRVSGGCSFNYSPESTPKISSVQYPAQMATVGDLVTFTFELG